jgi:hypothetical protein
MARSYRKTPVTGVAYLARSDKSGKRQANHALRVATNKALSNCDDFEDLIDPEIREVSDVRGFPKEGKSRIKGRLDDKLEKLMRK